MRLLKLSLALLPCLAIAAVPTVQSVTDSAGYGARVAPGSLASLFGANLAANTAAAEGFPLPTILGGTTVSVAGILAPLLYVSDSQINFQVPSGTKTGSINIVVNGPGGASAAFSFTVTAQAPSIFQYGSNRAVAQNADFSLNSETAPAAAGSVITVYLTGQGAVDHPVTDGTPTPSSQLATATATGTATIGPLNAPVQFLGLTPDFAGLAQANIQVPSLPTGNYPLVITAGNFIGASAIVSISGSGTYSGLLTPFSSAAFSNVNPNSIALYSKIAYVCGANRIVMVDVSDISTPTVIGDFGASVLNGVGNRCAINTTSGGTPYLVDIVGRDSGDLQSLAVFTLSNPAAPGLLTVASTPYSHIEDLSFSGVYCVATTSYITYFTATGAVASQHGDYLVFSFSNPAAPTFVTAMQPSALPGSSDQNLKPFANFVARNYAYVASSTATGTSTTGAAVLDIVDMTLPYAPNSFTQIVVPQAAILLSFDISGNTLLAAGNTSGQRNPGVPDFDFTGYLTLTSMDVTNLQLPTIVSTITTQTQVNGTFYTSAFNNGVFAIVNKPPATDNSGPASLMIVDARRPASLALYPFQTQFGFSGMVTTTDGYLLAPTALGLNIYQLQQ